MKKRMKVIIAYDGSYHADAAIDDLRRAGLPRSGDALIISIADIPQISAASCETGVLGRFVSTRVLEETIAMTQKETTRIKNEAAKLATSGCQRVSSALPDWQVKSQTAFGIPADELLKKADEFKPDLIVVGSHGRGTIGRFFLGSVSQKIAEKAKCSVRIARRRSFEQALDAPVKIIVCADRLLELERVVRAFGRRAISDKTEMRLIKVNDGVAAGNISAVHPYDAARIESSSNKLREIGFKVSVVIKNGNLKSALLEEANGWGADSIFIAARGTHNESSLSQTAAGLITDAHCTVEVIR